MAKNKTTITNNSVAEYINNIADEKKRRDCLEIIELMKKQTGFEPKMWGTSIIGFGSYHYKYESGHEGDAPLVGFASRTNAIVLYASCDFDKKQNLLANLGKHTTGKSCIYIKELADVNTEVLSDLVKCSVEYLQKKYSS